MAAGFKLLGVHNLLSENSGVEREITQRPELFSCCATNTKCSLYVSIIAIIGHCIRGHLGLCLVYPFPWAVAQLPGVHSLFHTMMLIYTMFTIS